MHVVSMACHFPYALVVLYFHVIARILELLCSRYLTDAYLRHSL